MADPLYQPQIDYTSRDYASIRDDLIGLIPNFAPKWTSRDSSDFGIVLIELFSYLGDLLNYQIDRAANEAFIDTATQRTTVINLARLLGYTPNGLSPATGTITLTNGTANNIDVPQGTQVQSSEGYIYTTDSDVNVLASSTATVTVTQGTVISSELLGQSNGKSFQQFTLSKVNAVINGELVVTVNGSTYTRVDYLVDKGPNDLAYTTFVDGNGSVHIQFGDGVSGKIPPNQSAIVASYRYLNEPGSLGNIGSGGISTISVNSILPTNAKPFAGGSDAESTDSIRLNATKALRTLNRAVSLSDYESIAIGTAGIAKAHAISSAFQSISLYVASANGAPLTSTLSAKVLNNFTNKTPPNTSIVINDFVPAHPYLNINVQVLPQYNQAAVLNDVRNALTDLFSFDNVSFADLITEGDIYSACKSVNGVSYITINDFEKLSNNPNQTSGVYSQTATVNAATSSSTTAVITANTCGVFTGSKIVLVGGSASASGVGATITNVTSNGSGTTNTITLDSAATFAANALITVVGKNGTTAGSRDFACAVNEVPIYVDSYITLNGSGGF